MGKSREPNSFPASKPNRKTIVNEPQSNAREQNRLEQERQRRYTELLQRVTERVWQLWMADLRHDQERQGQRRKQR